MQEVINNFEERVLEVELYFDYLKKLYRPNAQIYFPRARTNKYCPIDPELLKILKANSFLILYNLIESSVRDGVLAIYHELERKQYTYETVRKELKKIWIDFHYKNVYDISANYNSYRKQATKLIDMAVDGAIIKLDRNAIPISGNLDADQIRIICEMHGIEKKLKPSAKGGRKLSTVKTQRNALAHGSLSFSECGRSFSVEDLSEIKKESIIFLRNILLNMKKYYDNELYDTSKII